jgi:hypothetical protein
VQNFLNSAAIDVASAPIIACTIAGINLILTLPSVVGNAGLTYKIVIVATAGTHTLTIAAAGVEKINGVVSDTIVLNTAHQTVSITSVGDSWYINL